MMESKFFTNQESIEILNQFFNLHLNDGLLTKDHINKNYEKLRKPIFWAPSGMEQLIKWTNPYRGLTVKKNFNEILSNIEFGFKGGIFFSSGEFYYCEVTGIIDLISRIKGPFAIEEILSLDFRYFQDYDYIKYYRIIYNGEAITYNGGALSDIPSSNNEIELIKKLQILISEKVKVKEGQRLTILSNSKENAISQFDKDNDGVVDLIDGDSFNRLVQKNQKLVIDIDKSYLQKFVKISSYLKTKKSNTQKIFESIKDTKDDYELKELVNLLKNQIHTYELLVFHSINMITSLVDSDLITFYEIYECFDMLSVFNSNWENEVSNKLTDIGEGIRELMYSIYQMESKIVTSIDNLTYTAQDSFRELNNSVNNQLSSINSSIKFNNLLTSIQTYQMYRINQNTKSLN